MPQAPTKPKTASLHDTRRCPFCKEWIVCRHDREELDDHIKSEHPDGASQQSAYRRELLGLKEGEPFPMSEDGETTTTKTKAPRAPKAEKPALPCGCGCGMIGKPGSRFVMGHDARLDGMLTRWLNGKATNDDFPISDEVAAELLPAFHGGKFAALATEKGRAEALAERIKATEAAEAAKAAKAAEREQAAQARAEAREAKKKAEAAA